MKKLMFTDLWRSFAVILQALPSALCRSAILGDDRGWSERERETTILTVLILLIFILNYLLSTFSITTTRKNTKKHGRYGSTTNLERIGTGKRRQLQPGENEAIFPGLWKTFWGWNLSFPRKFSFSDKNLLVWKNSHRDKVLTEKKFSQRQNSHWEKILTETKFSPRNKIHTNKLLTEKTKFPRKTYISTPKFFSQTGGNRSIFTGRWTLNSPVTNPLPRAPVMTYPSSLLCSCLSTKNKDSSLRPF